MYAVASRIGDDNVTTTILCISWHTNWFISWNRYAV